MSKKCGSCTWFQKIKSCYDGRPWGNSGLCLYYDGRTDEDNKCHNWKGIKYERKKFRYKGGEWWKGTN